MALQGWLYRGGKEFRATLDKTCGGFGKFLVHLRGGGGAGDTADKTNGFTANTAPDASLKDAVYIFRHGESLDFY